MAENDFNGFPKRVWDKFDDLERLVLDKHVILRQEIEPIKKALLGDLTKPNELGIVAKVENLMLAVNDKDLRLDKIEGEDRKEEGRLKDMEGNIKTALNRGSAAHGRLDQKDGRNFLVNLTIFANFLTLIGLIIVMLLTRG